MKTANVVRPATEKTVGVPCTRLSDVRSGTRHRIAELEAGNHETIQKMILMGALPGKVVEVIQRFPAFLIGLGNSQFAVDRELAEKILVHTGESQSGGKPPQAEK